jgi:DNA-binding transcriptional ArsR family regulator
MEQSSALADRAQRAASFLRALSNEKRLRILCRLSRREYSVGELGRTLGIRLSTLSQHLMILREHDLVEARRDGKTIYYRMTSREREVVLGLLDALIHCPKDSTPFRKESRKTGS